MQDINKALLIKFTVDSATLLFLEYYDCYDSAVKA